MESSSDPAMGDASSGSRAHAVRWLIVGGDLVVLEQIALTLSRFGVDAEPALRDPASARHRLVLCDVRLGTNARPWADDLLMRTAPIVFLGANSVRDRARLIEAGAADALGERVAPREMVARLRAAERLHAVQQGRVGLAGFAIDLGLRQATWQGRALPLMPREFDLLLVLARHAGAAVRREDLLRAVWRTPFDPGTNSVEVHICKLRRSLAPLRGHVRIETVRQFGYRLVTMSPSKG